MVIVRKSSFKVIGYKPDMKLKYNKYVYMCSKKLAEAIAKEKLGFQMEIIVDENKVRCKPREKSIKEISIARNN